MTIVEITQNDQRTKVLQALAIEFGAQTVTNWLIWLSTQKQRKCQ